MSLNQQIASLIETAKALGLQASDVADEIIVRWGAEVPAPPLDPAGRWQLPSGKWIFLPAPLREAAEAWEAGTATWPAPLTELQIGNIRYNCCVDDHGFKQPAGFAGFSDGTTELPVSYLGARYWTYQEVEDPLIPGKVSKVWKDNGAFQPRTDKTRFETYNDAIAYYSNYTGP